MVSSFHASLQLLAELPVPVVCAAQGAIAGGGLGLLWASDLVLLAEDAKLTTAFNRLGLSGDGGSSWYLPRMLGTRQALQLLLRGPALDARQALELGLAEQVVPGSELDSAARAAAAEFAAGPTRAYGEMRQNIRGAFARTLHEGLDAELASMRRTGATADARAGVEAFSVGERPAFRNM